MSSLSRVLGSIAVLAVVSCGGDDAGPADRWVGVVNQIGSALCECAPDHPACDPDAPLDQCEREVLRQAEGEIREQLDCYIEQSRDALRCLRDDACDGTADATACLALGDLGSCDELPSDVQEDLQDCGQDPTFSCDDDSEIPRADRCDGSEDCPDGEDEENCGQPIPEDAGPGMSDGGMSMPPACDSAEFECESGECIETTNRCDAFMDCGDGSDEVECTTCRGTAFHCDTDQCISGFEQCDGAMNCSDGSDEEDCTCETSEYQCADGACIGNFERCDGSSDCMDGSDERMCTMCVSGLAFHCETDQCVATAARCNGQMDCTDGSDEVGCPGSCGDDYYMCEDGSCLPLEQRCDGVPDCDTSSTAPTQDETACTACMDGSFFCTSSAMCVIAAWVCDGEAECPEHEDEASCGPCVDGEFMCDNGECRPMLDRCDKIVDCANEEDEANCPV